MRRYRAHRKPAHSLTGGGRMPVMAGRIMPAPRRRSPRVVRCAICQGTDGPPRLRPGPSCGAVTCAERFPATARQPAKHLRPPRSVHYGAQGVQRGVAGLLSARRPVTSADRKATRNALTDRGTIGSLKRRDGSGPLPARPVNRKRRAAHKVIPTSFGSGLVTPDTSVMHSLPASAIA